VPISVDPTGAVFQEPRLPWENPFEMPPPPEWFLEQDWFKLVYNTADTDLRAHRIALTYYYLGGHLDAFLNEGESCTKRLSEHPAVPINANWFHFAMWGTLTVTQNMNNQRSPQRLNSGIPAPLRRRLTPAILRARAADGQRVGRALAWGQLAIFVSATQMVTEVMRPAGLDGVSAEAMLTRIKENSGVSNLGIDPTRHVEPMKKAFEYYELASGTTSTAEQAWLMLGANVLLTAAEQDLVDVAIEVVLDHLPQHVGGAIDWRLAKLSERLRGVPPNLAYTLLESMHPNERGAIYTIWSRLMTDQVLVMALPTEALRLGRDIPPRHREWPIFPPDLRQFPDVGPDAATAGSIQHLPEMKEIVSLVKSLDRTVRNQGTRGSAARDWRRWDERMNWALALIRTRQQDETLFWAPYSVADQWRIVYGEMPVRLADASTLDVQAPTGQNVAALVQKPAS
jgi:hypothetical protein